MATLTRQQLIQNIESLETQGASQGEIQEYLNSQSQTPTETQAKSILRPVELAESLVGGVREEVGEAADVPIGQ